MEGQYRRKISLDEEARDQHRCSLPIGDLGVAEPAHEIVLLELAPMSI
jgi:hypothetical protein